MAQYDIDLRDYWRILRKRKVLVLLMVALAGLFSYGFAKMKEPVPLYEATAGIKIERQTSMADFFSGGFLSPTENLVTHAFILTNFPVLTQTGKLLGWLPPDLTIEQVLAAPEHLSVVQRLKGMIEAGPEAGTNILNIRVVSRDPKEAASVANAVVEAYRRYNIEEKNRRTFETKAFIEAQLDLTAGRLRQAEEALQRFKETHSLTALDIHTEDLLRRISEAEVGLERTEHDRQAVAKQLNVVDRALSNPATLDSLIPLVQGMPDYELRAKINALILERQGLLVEVTARHPRVDELNSQIRAMLVEARKELAAMQAAMDERAAEISDRLETLRDHNRKIPLHAQEIDRLTRDVRMQDSLYSELKTKYQEVLIQESGKIEEVSVVRPALASGAPINIPSKMVTVASGLVLGLIIGLVFVFVAEVLDTSIGTIEDVEGLLKVPVLGVIPFIGGEDRAEGDHVKSARQDLVTHFEPASLAAEAFRALRTNLQVLNTGAKGQTILITSSFVREGKTFSAANLALSLAQDGSRVLLIEADLRKSRVHRLFGLEREPGLTDYVLGNYRWQDVVCSITDLMVGTFEIEEILKTPGMDNLNIITVGGVASNPSETLRSSRFKELIQEARRAYAFVIIDAPPILPVADATEIAPLVDSVLLVYKAGEISRVVVRRAKATLDNVKARVCGVILNSVKPEVGPDYFKYHAQYYYRRGEKSFAAEKSRKSNRPRFGGLFVVHRRRTWILLAGAVVLLAAGLFWHSLKQMIAVLLMRF